MRKLAMVAFGAGAGVLAVFGVNYFLVADALRPEPPGTVRLAEMTWPEVRQALSRGVDTVIVPFGGTEQGGLHLVLGKHNHIAAEVAGRAARELGNVLVAPVMPFAPEGAFAPPDSNMAYSGTLGLRQQTLAAVAEDLARSLKSHGVPMIVFITDHGLSVVTLGQVAARLDATWRPEGTRVVHVQAYYSANGQSEWLAKQGHSGAKIGTHAGIRDTSELMYVYPSGVRLERRYAPSIRFSQAIGTDGDPSLATAEIGKKMLDLKVKALVDAIRKLRKKRKGQ